MELTNKTARKRTGFYGLLALIIILAFVRYGLQVPVPKLSLLAVAMVIAFRGDRDEILAMCICCIPLQESIDMFMTLTGCMLVWLVKYGGSLRIHMTVVPVLAMVAWELMHSVGDVFSPVDFFSLCIPLLVLLFVMGSPGRYDYDFIVRAFAVTTAGMCVVLFGRLLFYNDFDLAATISGLQRLGRMTAEEESAFAISGGALQVNTFGILCVLGITGYAQLRMAGRGKKGDVLLLVFLLVFGALSASRTYLACLVFMAVLLVFSQKGGLDRKVRMLLAILGAAGVALLLLWLIFPETLAYFYSRFFEDDITTGRDRIFVQYHRFIVSQPKYWLFGIGMQELGEKALVIHRIASHVPHNGIQEIVLVWGIPGLVLVGGLLAAMLWRARAEAGKRELLSCIPLLVILFKSMAGQFLSSGYTMLSLTFVYLSLCETFEPGTDELPDSIHETGGILL